MMAKILLVEDDAMIQWALDEALTDAGHTVLQAATGSQAGELIGCHPDIDVLVTDIGLAGSVSGLQLSQFWRSKSKRPTIFISGSAPAELGILAVGPQDVFLPKPFRAEALIALVERLTGATSVHVMPAWQASSSEKRAS